MWRSQPKQSKSWRCCKDLFPSNTLKPQLKWYIESVYSLRLLKLSTWAAGCFWFCYTDQYFKCKYWNRKTKTSMWRWGWSIWEYLQNHSLIRRGIERGYCLGSKQPWIGPNMIFQLHLDEWKYYTTNRISQGEGNRDSSSFIWVTDSNEEIGQPK